MSTPEKPDHTKTFTGGRVVIAGEEAEPKVIDGMGLSAAAWIAGSGPSDSPTVQPKCSTCLTPMTYGLDGWYCRPCWRVGLERAAEALAYSFQKAADSMVTAAQAFIKALPHGVVYISGPITGRPNENREAFAEAAAALVFDGWAPINPQDIHTGAEDRTWLGYMRRDIKALAECDAVFMLEGWRGSRGARVEYLLARGLGLRVMFQRPSLRDRIADLYWRTK